MAVTARLYAGVFEAAFDEEIDLLADNIAVTLHTSTYTPDQDVHDYRDDVTNELTTAGGYTAGGQNLASKTFNYTAGSNLRTFDAADVQWTTTTLTWRTAVISDITPGTAATNPLICYQQSDTDIISTGGNTDIVWNASGIFTITIG